jgi:hypothetical protein
MNVLSGLTMIRITAEHIYVLRNSTGKPFTDLLDRLIRSSAATLGIARSAVLDNPRTNYPDGGVDTQVTAGAQLDPCEYFNGPTAWQYKAVALKDFTDTKVKEEISGDSKDYVRSLLKKGYAYRLCIADDGPAERKTEIKALLDLEIKRINPEAPESVVLFASEVVGWVNTFPAIAADMLGSSMKDFFHFATWQNRERAFTKTFVATPESTVIIQNVQSHVDWKNKPTMGRLTVSGDAGVGKSRTVFEAIASLNEVAPLTIYTDDEDKALDLARAMANDQNLYAVLVADECLDATAFQLAKILQGVERRVRLITIDNALERMDRSELRLNRLSTPTVEKIVEANFPNIDQNRRYRYCQLAEGYLRFAIFLCDHDDLIVQQGHLGELLSDTRAYLASLFGGNGPFEQADFEALMVISLVERCGVIGNVSVELEQLCGLVGLDPKEVRERLHRMQKSNGLVSRAGRYFYVTPTPIAMVCFQAAWSKWAELDPKAFLESFPPGLVRSFLARMARAPEEVGRVVNAYFRNWELSRGSDIFTDANETERFLLLVRADPDRMVPRLRSLVLTATPEQLRKQHGGGRRNLVVEAAEIAAFPQWFFIAEEILFALASCETEPGLGNNATKVWLGLFPIMSYVATSFDERLKLIQERCRTGDAATRILCIEALQSALDDRTIHMMSGQTYGNRIAPTPWSPKTYGELYEYMKSCLSELNKLSSDPDDAVREKATTTLVGCIRGLVFRGFTQQAKEGAGSLPPHLRPILRAELREFVLLNNSEHSPHSEEEKKQRAQFVDEWVRELASTDLHDRLVEEIGPDAWEHHLEQTEWEHRIAELASHLLQHEDDFERELPWLNSDKARSSVELGLRLGRLDENLLLLDRVVAACRATRNPNLSRGYFAGVSESMRPKLQSDLVEPAREKLNKSLDAIWADDPVLAFHVMTPSGEFVDSFARAINGVRERKIPAGFLRTLVAWNGPRHTSPAEASLAAQTLLQAALAGDDDAADTGIEFIVFLLMRVGDSVEKLVWLQTVFKDESLNVIFGLLEQATQKSKKLSYWFPQIFARILPANPDRATSILIQMMQSDSYETSQTAAGLFASVAAVRPQRLMEGIGEAVLSKERNLNFLFRKYPIVLLPEDVLIEWLEQHGLEGARLLARHVPAPFIGTNGPELHPVTRFILENYGNDEMVFASWFAGMHSGGAFAGSIADHMEQRATRAEPFLNFPIEAVRRWALAEIKFANENAESFRMSEEELF